MVIINDILDFSKIKSGKLTLENVAFNINDSVNQSVRALKPRAEEKNITLDYFINPNVPAFVLGDQVRLNQILTNLIGNALKFTQKGGVKLSVEATSDQDNGLQVWFSVNDSGIGIPEEKQELIFDSFTQSSSDTTRKYGGTGLGLSIVKQLVELHSGTISIESKENVGSTFKVGLPYKETYITAENIQKVIDETVYTELAGKRILIVDDNDINLMVAKQTLKKVGISAQTVTGGKEALEMLLNQDFDAVLLDVHMPDMNGYETCRNIRVALKMNIPVIAMTAAAMVEDEEKCLQAGMNGYIAKPFVPKDLYALLMTYV
jgi:CheY-like chemotaxis protein